MTTEEQRIQNQISSIWSRTDTFLKKHDDNCLLLFDFTTVSHYDNGSIKIKSIYQYKIKDYPKLLDEYFYGHGYSIPEPNEVELSFYSISDANVVALDNPKEEIYDPGTVTNTKTVKLDTWYEFVKKKKMAGQCWTLFKHFFNNDESKERIEVGVYILLKNSFPSDENDKNKIKDFIHYEVLKFLWDKGLEYFSNSYIEKIKQDEELERLRNVSASAHVFKTTINGLFAPSLNSLLQETNVDPRILELEKVKSKLLKYAEVVNLMTKLSSKYKDKVAIKESLTGSGLFTMNPNEIGKIKSVYEEILKLRKEDSSLTALTFEINQEALAKDVFVYEDEYYPTKSFYELLLLTIIENAVEHGANDDGKLTVIMNLFENEITFVNKPKPNSKKEIRKEDMTGNFRVFRTILNRLELGEFDVSNNNDEFKVTLKTKENG